MTQMTQMTQGLHGVCAGLRSAMTQMTQDLDGAPVGDWPGSSEMSDAQRPGDRDLYNDVRVLEKTL
jgi:hypothetical protein